MKKIAALLLAAVLCVSVIPAAGASEDKTARVDIVEYTWEEALDAIGAAEWEGLRYTLKDAKLKYWLPYEFTRAEITEAVKQAGYLAYHVSADQSLVMAVTRSEAVTTQEDFIEALEDYDAADVRVQNINGMDWILYEDVNFRQKPSGTNEYGFRCLVAAQPTEKGVVEFVFYIQSAEAEYMANVIMASMESVK